MNDIGKKLHEAGEISGEIFQDIKKIVKDAIPKEVRVKKGKTVLSYAEDCYTSIIKTRIRLSPSQWLLLLFSAGVLLSLAILLVVVGLNKLLWKPRSMSNSTTEIRYEINSSYKTKRISNLTTQLKQQKINVCPMNQELVLSKTGFLHQPNHKKEKENEGRT